jgi:hypothetical protein
MHSLSNTSNESVVSIPQVMALRNVELESTIEVLRPLGCIFRTKRRSCRLIAQNCPDPARKVDLDSSIYLF